MAPRQLDAAIQLVHANNLEEKTAGIYKIKHLIIGNRTGKLAIVDQGAVPMYYLQITRNKRNNGVD